MTPQHSFGKIFATQVGCKVASVPHIYFHFIRMLETKMRPLDKIVVFI